MTTLTANTTSVAEPTGLRTALDTAKLVFEALGEGLRNFFATAGRGLEVFNTQ